MKSDYTINHRLKQVRNQTYLSFAPALTTHMKEDHKNDH